MRAVHEWFLALLDPDRDAGALPAMQEDAWAKLLRVLDRHGLSGWADRTRENRGDMDLPETVRKSLHSRHVSAKLRGARLQQEYDAIHAALKKEGIDCVPLKGMDLMRSVYGDPGLRPVQDMDILLLDRDIVPALKVLEGLDYVQPRRLLPMPVLRRFHFHVACVKKKVAIAELHWGISDRLTLRAGWRELYEIRRVDGRAMLCRIPDAHMLAFLAAHCAKHAMVLDRLRGHPAAVEMLLHPLSDFRAIWMVDLFFGLQKLPTTVEYVLKAAEAMGCINDVYPVFELCSRLFSRFPRFKERETRGKESGRTRWAKDYVMRQLQTERAASVRESDMPWLLRTNPVFHVRPIRVLMGGQR